MDRKTLKHLVRNRAQVLLREVNKPTVHVVIGVTLTEYGEHLGEGLATCSAKDKWDPERGYEIALGRAVTAIVDKIMPREAEEEWGEPITIRVVYAGSWTGKDGQKVMTYRGQDVDVLMGEILPEVM